jgi:hypothetical protein
MGEPEVVEIPQLDMGEEPIDNAAAVAAIPTAEAITDFEVHKTKSDKKWSTFVVGTDKRQLTVQPGDVGEESFNNFCAAVKAMFETEEGQAVKAKMKAFLRSRPYSIPT